MQSHAFPPSEGVQKMCGKSSPSEGGKGAVEGETQLQLLLAGVPPLRTFGRCVENVGKVLTFGRWGG